MAKTIESIQEEIIDGVKKEVPVLAGEESPSKTSEWKLWTHIVATVIHAFEHILDLFRKEVDTLTNKITPGTVRWYAEMCKRFQYGHPLVFDEDTALLYYEDTADEASKIIAAVSITESDTTLAIKVAKYKNQEKKELESLNQEELKEFKDYIDAIKFAGCKTDVTSSDADEMRYTMTVYRNPAYGEEVLRENVLEALQVFKTSVDFDSVVYRQKLIDAVMHVDGVTTCDLTLLEHIRTQDDETVVSTKIGTHTVLQAGYFNWTEDSELVIKTVNELIKQ
ncbi:MAG: hypothetical protein K2O66_01105 [Bacteroidales bacterium]|nr:hypothetical protein [Bacteroidales bacterium]MDE7071947.1 hypothetical protein [Bacteroidales bacterium]